MADADLWEGYRESMFKVFMTGTSVHVPGFAVYPAGATWGLSDGC